MRLNQFKVDWISRGKIRIGEKLGKVSLEGWHYAEPLVATCGECENSVSNIHCLKLKVWNQRKLVNDWDQDSR